MLAGLNPKVHPLELTDTYGRFAVEPLERGYGDTLGNAFRRVLLAHIEGATVTDRGTTRASALSANSAKPLLNGRRWPRKGTSMSALAP